MNPAELKYAKSHEWVAIDGDVATLGISDFAVRQLTDLVYIDLPAMGKNIVAGETFGEVESVKAVSDLYAPVTGEIIAVNDGLPGDLGQLSDDPFGTGWMVRVRVSDPSSLSSLLDAEAYRAHCDSEQH